MLHEGLRNNEESYLPVRAAGSEDCAFESLLTSSLVLCTQSLSAFSIPICEMKETETFTTHGVFIAQCMEEIWKGQMELSKDILGQS